MTLFELALKNIRRNLKTYSLYIGSTVFSILIYFTFATLKYSGDIEGMAETSKKISGVMSGSAFVLMIFVAIFILYSNSFFMKKRKKEVALYSLLGVRKKSIGLLLFFENMVIGLFSLVIGVVLGLALSNGLLSILLKLMGIEVVTGLPFSLKALLHTCLVFFVIFLGTSTLGYRVIYRFKLIELFQADKTGEAQPKAKILAALGGIIALSLAYYFALEDLLTSVVWQKLGLATPLVIIALTIVGSYLLFHSVLIYVLLALKNRPKWAWKGLRMMTASQLLYRIRGNAKTLTTIAVMSATTITAGGAVFGLYYNIDQSIDEYTPYTFMWEGQAVEIESDDIISESSFPVKYVRILEEGYEMEYALLKEQDFTQLSTRFEEQNTDALKEEEIYVVDAFYDERWSSKKEVMTIDDNEYTVAKLYDRAFWNIATVGGVAVVVPDHLYEELALEEKTIQAVEMENSKKQLALSEELASKTESFSSAPMEYQRAIESSGALLFVGSFLGLVFLVATGSIIFFKMLTEVEEDKSKYVVLRKMGVSMKDIKRTIQSQIGVIFAVPLLLGIVHSSVALMAASRLFMMDFVVPVMIWMAAYTLIYAVYYIVTVNRVMKMIMNEK